MPRASSSNKPRRRNVLSALAELSEAVGTRFDQVDRGLLRLKEGTDARFDKIDRRLDDLQQQINRIEAYILQDHERRLEKIEDKLGMR